MAKKLKTIKIEKTKYPNIGIGYFGDDHREMHVKGAIVGQVVEAVPGRNRPEYRDGKLYSLVEKSPLETYDGCIHKEECGGCVYQSFEYPKELDYKEAQIRDLFSDHNIDLEKIVKSPDYMGYRNKMEYTFGDEYKDSPLALGMHKKNKFYEIVNIDKCLIVHSDFNTIIKEVRKYFENLGIKHLHKKTKEGNLRHLVVRRSQIGQILINLVVTSSTEFSKEDFVDFLLSLDLEGEIKNIFLTYNDSLSDAVIPEKVEKLYGQDYIEEELLDLKFKIRPFSFFQTNTKSAEVLYQEAISLLENIQEKTIFDLYCGIGTITQILGKKAKKVIGIEIVEEAVESAKETAKENKIDNVDFIAGDVLEKVDQLEEKPDIIVLDPPRDGIHPKAIEKIINFSPETFLYISCNPKTLVRDIQVFTEKGYKVEKALAVDQFPRTAHVETVCLMSREEK